MDKIMKIVYAFIIIAFLIIIGVMGWYIIDEKKITDNEIASLKSQLNSNMEDYERSEKKIENPEDVRIVREYHHLTSTSKVMRVLAFDLDSKLVWMYDTDNTTEIESNFDISWAGNEAVYIMEENKVIILSSLTGEKIQEVMINSGYNEKINLYRQHGDDLYIVTDLWVDAGTKLKHKVYKINKLGDIINSKEIDALYDGFDQTVESVSVEFDGENMTVYIDKSTTERLDKLVDLGF